MINGLDLFSGIGGITVALSEWVKPVAYCEIDRYAQAVLLSRMETGDISTAPIWDDITTLKGSMLPDIDIIYGGFPCQDISIAGTGAGLGGKRSGLFFEIARLIDEIRPRFVFLENVPAITFRGLDAVCSEITKLGYGSRWCTISAKSIGASHKRERWFYLAYANSNRPDKLQQEPKESIKQGIMRDGCDRKNGQNKEKNLANPKRTGREPTTTKEIQHWSSIEPCLCRELNDVPHRVDRIKSLGNAVVPKQAKEAFKILMGIKEKQKK